MPALVQRYNMPKLKILEKRALRNAARRKNAEKPQSENSDVEGKKEEV